MVFVVKMLDRLKDGSSWKRQLIKKFYCIFDFEVTNWLKKIMKIYVNINWNVKISRDDNH